MKNKKSGMILISLVFILLIATFVQSIDEEGNVDIIILEEPTIILGDNEGGNDAFDDDGTIWATLTTDTNVKDCEINWEGSWQAIPKTTTSTSHIYLSGGTKTVYYRCYDDNDNFVTVDDSILIGECQIDNDCNYLDSDYCSGDLVKRDEGICISNECTTQTTTIENCNNGLFCDGEETCNAAACVTGMMNLMIR